MSIIQKMDAKLANMIAAGEVVDRPASILKELVENAIDAHATEITIEVYEMGMKKIVVTDNGDGMDFLDAHLAFERHATSKIKVETDLSHIGTLGFRGEALAAIASVSKINLKTRQKDQEGIMVVYHGGHHVKDEKAALNVGTCIEVMDLFYNTPARFKYIKSEFAEKAAIIDIFDRLALANPHIRMKLIMDDKLIKQTFGHLDPYSLIDQIYGSKVTVGMVTCEDTFQKISIKGYLLSPQVARSRKKDISVFINGRYIKNYQLTQAVIDGYHSLQMVGKYPIAMIYLTIDPSLVDVNVHPQKYEVKFVNESLIAYHLTQVVSRALNASSHPIPDSFKVIEKKIEKETSYQKIELDLEDSSHAFHMEEPSTQAMKIPDMYYVGTVSGTYLIFQNEEGMYMMDQHAAEERIRYEYYYHKLEHPIFTSQMLLTSYQLSMTKEDYEVLKHYVSKFEAYGFTFDHDFHLTGRPVWLKESEIDLAIESMIQMLDEKGVIDLKTLRDALAKDISCKGAIKANQALSRIEIDALLKTLKTCQNPYTCPHGRPTLIKLSFYDIERMFKRVVS
jgi:DNA mismatch repair protein MutL